MRRKLCFALVVCAVAGILPGTYLRPRLAVGADSGGGGCFSCDDWQDEEWQWKHRDYPLFDNDKHGTMHSGPSPFNCESHIEYSN